MPIKKPDSPIKNAISKAIETAGGPSECARRLSTLHRSITPQGVSRWKSSGTIPAEWVKHLAKVGKVKRARLAPGLYS